MTKALRYSRFGDPLDVLKLETVELAPLSADHLRVKMIMTPIIHPI